IYQVVYTNQNNCDRIRELDLVITNTPSAPMTSGDQILCDGATPTDVTIATTSGAPFIISGIMDGPLPGGFPKCIEFYAIEDIADLSIFGFGSANNGGGTDGEEFTFPNIALTAGSHYRVGTDSLEFFNFFGYYPEEADTWAGNVNGDDAIELFMNAAVIDVFGDINTDGTGQPWEYLDGWAYRVNGSQPNNGAFDINEWTFSGINALDNETTNATAVTPFPEASFSTSPAIITHTWYDDAGLTNQIATGETYTPTLTGIGAEFYYITAELNGCTSPATMVEVSVNALPIVVANSTATTICETDMITLTGTGADTYTWDNGATDGVAFDPATTTTFTVTGTDVNGCTNTDMITVTVNPLPTVSMTAISQVCVYDVAFDLTGGSPAGGSYAGTGVSNDQFDPATAGIGTHTITYSITDGNGCTNDATTDIVVDACSNLEEIIAPFISIYPNPTFGTITINTNINKINSVEVIDLTGKVLINTQSTTIDLSDLSSGKYIVRVSTNDSIHRTTVIKK
ncbi:MAG: T9SS type A sorting domain-containing protein, partial [Crocinitomicaceae bacterium]